MRSLVSALSPRTPRPSATANPRARKLARLSATAGLALALAIPLALLSRQIWREWLMLAEEEQAVATGGVIGFRNVYPAISRAEHPEPWRRAEGADLFVWAGWKPGAGHRWFRLASGDCDLATLGDPIGRDVARAIDDPDVETGGGEIWGRLPDEAEVAGLATGKTACAYPMMVLSKVLVVNDVIDGLPRLVHHDPYSGAGGRPGVSVYDARVDDRRILLGCGGFTLDRRHVLYDRGTESLWVERGDGMTAFSGKLKGKRLPLVGRLHGTKWGDWRTDNPGSQLLVGAIQPPAIPVTD